MNFMLEMKPQKYILLANYEDFLASNVSFFNPC